MCVVDLHTKKNKFSFVPLMAAHFRVQLSRMISETTQGWLFLPQILCIYINKKIKNKMLKLTPGELYRLIVKPLVVVGLLWYD